MEKSFMLVVFYFSGLSSSVYGGRWYSTSATGRILCQFDNTNHPLKEIIVKLRDHDVVFHDTFGTTRTRTDGTFSVSGRARDLFGRPDPFLELKYEYSGTFGRMEIDGFLGVTRKERTSKRSHSRNINYGDWIISNDHCRAYVQFYEAIKDYRERTGRSLPYRKLNIRTRAIIHGGTPYSERSKINIPRASGEKLRLGIAKHELGHTIRHTCDGNYAHFLYDVARFNYLRRHSCDSQTNEGFAFNEGWAEYWEGDCNNAPYGDSSTDYTIEGNVANALRNLQRNCRLSYAAMVDVLCNNRGNIHSYGDFERASGC